MDEKSMKIEQLNGPLSNKGRNQRPLKLSSRERRCRSLRERTAWAVKRMSICKGRHARDEGRILVVMVVIVVVSV